MRAAEEYPIAQHQGVGQVESGAVVPLFATVEKVVATLDQPAKSTTVVTGAPAASQLVRGLADEAAVRHHAARIAPRLDGADPAGELIVGGDPERRLVGDRRLGGIEPAGELRRDAADERRELVRELGPGVVVEREVRRGAVDLRLQRRRRRRDRRGGRGGGQVGRGEMREGAGGCGGAERGLQRRQRVADAGDLERQGVDRRRERPRRGVGGDLRLGRRPDAEEMHVEIDRRRVGGVDAEEDADRIGVGADRALDQDLEALGDAGLHREAVLAQRPEGVGDAAHVAGGPGRRSGRLPGRADADGVGIAGGDRQHRVDHHPLDGGVGGRHLARQRPTRPAA